MQRYVVRGTGEELRALRRTERQGVLPHKPGNRLCVGRRHLRVAALEEDGGLVLVEPEGAVARPEPESEWPGQRYVIRRTGSELEDLRHTDAAIPHKVGQLLVRRGVRYRVTAIEDRGDTALLERE